MCQKCECDQSLPISELIMCWVIDFVPENKLDLWGEIWNDENYAKCCKNLEWQMTHYLKDRKGERYER